MAAEWRSEKGLHGRVQALFCLAGRRVWRSVVCGAAGRAKRQDASGAKAHRTSGTVFGGTKVPPFRIEQPSHSTRRAVESLRSLGTRKDQSPAQPLASHVPSSAHKARLARDDSVDRRKRQTQRQRPTLRKSAKDGHPQRQHRLRVFIWCWRR